MLSRNVYYIYRNTSPATHTCYLWNNSITSLQFSCRQHPCFIVSPGNELLYNHLQCATCIDKKYAFPINNGSWTKKRITNLSYSWFCCYLSIVVSSSWDCATWYSSFEFHKRWSYLSSLSPHFFKRNPSFGRLKSQKSANWSYIVKAINPNVF